MEKREYQNDESRAAAAISGSEGEPRAKLDPVEVREQMVREIASWANVSVHEHRFGGVEFRLGRRELGHLHPRFADLPFPRRVRDELIVQGRARPHHGLPDSGWVTVPMRTAREIANVIELFRQNYERALGKPQHEEAEPGV